MSCAPCELRRAKKLYAVRLAMHQFSLDEFLTELDNRWPGRFFAEIDPGKSYRILQRNMVHPYNHAEVCTWAASTTTC